MFSEEFARRYPDFVEAFETLKMELAQTRRPPEETILDDHDLRVSLKVSQRTTATWGDARLISYSKIGNKIYYKLSDILDMIERHRIDRLTKLASGKIVMTGRMLNARKSPL